MHLPLVPIEFPKRLPLQEGKKLLAADVGATQTHLAVFELRQADLILVNERVYLSKDYNSISEIFSHFVGKSSMPGRVSIAFSGPVFGGKAVATNLGWTIDTQQLSKEFGVSQVFLINDLVSEGYGLAALKKKDLLNIYTGNPNIKGNAAIISPGAGLGEAGLFWDGAAFHPFATEGGHTDFAPRSEFDMDFLQYLQKIYGHVSWERVLSGKGICHLYDFLRDVKNWEEPASLKEKLQELKTGETIADAAQAGSPICVEVLKIFVRYLAIEASNLALKLNATGGVFIGGVIPQKIWNDDLQAIFLEHFHQVDRLRQLIEMVPVTVVLNTKTVLLGAGYYGKF